MEISLPPVLFFHVQQLLEDLVGENLLLGDPELLDRLPRRLPEVVRDHGDDHEDVAEAEHEPGHGEGLVRPHPSTEPLLHRRIVMR